MRYRVTIEGRSSDVDVARAADGTLRVSVDGRALDADVVEVPGGVCLRIEGRVHDVIVGGDPDAVSVGTRDVRAVASVDDGRGRRRRRGDASDADAAGELRAPMPGRIVEIPVAVGDAVEAGQAVVVVEAMKMQNELRAPSAGTVASIAVEVGQSVESKALLIRFE